MYIIVYHNSKDQILTAYCKILNDQQSKHPRMDYNIKHRTPIKTPTDMSTPRKDTPKGLTLKPPITPIFATGDLSSHLSRINDNIAEINARNTKFQSAPTPRLDLTPVKTPRQSAQLQSTPRQSAQLQSADERGGLDQTTLINMPAETVAIPPLELPMASASAPASTPASTPASASAPMTTASAISTAETPIPNMESLKFHIRVAPELWEEIPTGSMICYISAGNFFAKRSLKRIFRKENCDDLYFGFQPEERKRKSEVVAFKDVECLWKRYPDDSVIELILIHNSLRAKNIQIAMLEAKIAELSAIVYARK